MEGSLILTDLTVTDLTVILREPQPALLRSLEGLAADRLKVLAEEAPESQSQAPSERLLERKDAESEGEAHPYGRAASL